MNDRFSNSPEVLPGVPYVSPVLRGIIARNPDLADALRFVLKPTRLPEKWDAALAGWVHGDLDGLDDVHIQDWWHAFSHVSPFTVNSDWYFDVTISENPTLTTCSRIGGDADGPDSFVVETRFEPIATLLAFRVSVAAGRKVTGGAHVENLLVVPVTAEYGGKVHLAYDLYSSGGLE